MSRAPVTDGRRRAPGAPSYAGPRCAAAAHLRTDRGSVIVAVVLAALLAGAAGAGAWSASRARLLSAQRRAASARAETIARAACRAAATWFEAFERGSLTPPPPPGDVERDRRRVDRDGDGRGVPWRDAGADAVLYKSGAAGLFRPPDDGSAEHLFLGTLDGPDVLLEASGVGAGTLAELSRALGLTGGARVMSLAFSRPPPRAGPLALATITARAEVPLPGGAPASATVRAEAVAVPWGRADRPLVTEEDARLPAGATWSWGEAVIGGRLHAPPPGPSDRDGGIPWLAPDRPLRSDADGDGSADDADGDGTPDLSGWLADPEPVPDPWRRARIALDWPGVSDGAEPCAQPFPFGPRDRPPRAASRVADRSGVFTGCPLAEPPRAVRDPWLDVAERGLRGAVLVRGDDPAALAVPGAALALALGELLSPPGLVVVEPQVAGSELAIAAGGESGAIVRPGGALAVEGAGGVARPSLAPGGVGDTAGSDRLANRTDDVLAPGGASPDCSGWAPGPWLPPADPAASSARRPTACPDLVADYGGLLAAGGAVRLVGPLTVAGRVRARSLDADPAAGPVRVIAGPARRDEPDARPGPPGAPRVVAESLRSR